jgi:hypothetical protein
VSLGWKGNEEQRRGKKKERKEKKEEWCVGLGRKGRRRKEMGSVREREWSTG